MKRFEQTRYFQLLDPFINHILQRLLFRDERYILFVSQVLLSGLLYVLSTALQTLLLVLLSHVNLPFSIGELVSSLIHLSTVLVIYWCIWYALTIIFRMLGTMRLGSSWLSPRLLSCIITAGMTLSIGSQMGESLGHTLWFYTMLGLIWAYTCLRPTLFGIEQ